MNWLEISLTLDGELAEAVADVLARYAYQGVSTESTAVEANPEDEGRAVGPWRVRAYLPADDAGALESTREKIEHDLFYLGMIRPLPQPVYTRVADADWAELWKASYHPMRVGKRLVVVPAWLYDTFRADPATAPTDVPLLMDPGMAFGIGTHPTTQLCLGLIETHLRPGDSVLDLGCGSGILAVAAAKLGARSALAVDIDPESVRATGENAQANGVADKIETRLGSIDVALSQHSTLNTQYSKFDITVANIIAPVVVRLLGQGLGHTLAPGGTLIVSGILAEQADNVAVALREAGLAVVEQRQIGDWIAIAAR